MALKCGVHYNVIATILHNLHIHIFSLKNIQYLSITIIIPSEKHQMLALCMCVYAIYLSLTIVPFPVMWSDDQ